MEIGRALIWFKGNRNLWPEKIGAVTVAGDAARPGTGQPFSSVLAVGIEARASEWAPFARFDC